MGASAAVEPRAACPACGGQIHPIAGRCKHCKADLTRLREPRPARAARGDAMPFALAELKSSAPLGGGNGHAAPATATPYAATVVTPMSAAGGTAVEGGWSTRWPLVVAAIAILAIVASVAMLLFGGGDDDKKSSKSHRYEGPAPEMTPTDPMAPPITPGPPSGGGAPQPIQPSMPDPVPPPQPSPPPAASAPRDVEQFMHAAVDVGCRRMSTCSGNDPTIASYCSMATGSISQMSGQLQSLCPDYDAPAARECLDSLSRFPCPAGAADPTAMAATVMGLSGCQKVCAMAFRSMGGALGGGGTDIPIPGDPDDVDDPF